MTSQWILIAVFMTAGMFGVAGAARAYLRRPPSPEEFGKLFIQGWIWAGMLAMGTISLIQLLVREMEFTRMPLLPMIPLAFLVAGYPARWAAVRWYRRASTDGDFVEDSRGNPIRQPAPGEFGDEAIETWEDLVRAQRKHASSPY